jgi:hypothetical protein
MLVDKDQKVRGAAHFFKSIQEQDTFNDQWPVAPSFDAAIEIIDAPPDGSGYFASDHKQIELNYRHSELPSEPIRQGRFAYAISAVNTDEKRLSIRSQRCTEHSSKILVFERRGLQVHFGVLSHRSTHRI